MSDDKHDRVRVRGRNVQYKDTLSFHGKELINIPRSIVIKLRDGIKTFAERGGGGDGRRRWRYYSLSFKYINKTF